MKKEALDRFSAAVDGLLKEVSKEDPPKDEGMTPEQFVEYATAQVEKAKDDKDKGVARLKHLKAQIELLKNFEGSPSGVMPVTQFTDPGQVTTTEKTIPPSSDQSSGPSNFAANDVPPAGNGAQQPPGGKNPPIVASGSGFSSAFSKSMEDLDKKLEALLKSDEPPKDEPPKEDDAKAAALAKAADDAADVTWANDMASPYGMGQTDKDGNVIKEDAPPWGFDTGSVQKRRHDRIAKEAADAQKPAAKPAE